jgi:hypothetical protein
MPRPSDYTDNLLDAIKTLGKGVDILSIFLQNKLALTRMSQ